MLVNGMKLQINICSALTAVLFCMLTVSCSIDDVRPDTFRNYVTAVPLDDGAYCYFLLEGKTTLYPSSIWGSPAGPRKTRAVIEYRKTQDNYNGYDHLIDLIQLDTIPTRNLSAAMGGEDVRPSQPIEIMRTSELFIDDDYIHIPYGVIFGGQQTVHTVTLEPVGVSGGTYELRLVHTSVSFDDYHSPEDDMIAEALIAFDLTTFPIDRDEIDHVSIRYNSIFTEKEERITIDY